MTNVEAVALERFTAMHKQGVADASAALPDVIGHCSPKQFGKGRGDFGPSSFGCRCEDAGMPFEAGRRIVYMAVVR